MKNTYKIFIQPLIIIGSLLMIISSCEKERNELPVIKTKEVSDITASSAISGGIITDDGGSEVAVRGIVWDISENPTVEDNEGMTIDGVGAGEFTSYITGLSRATTYFVRSYATNSEGTAYGEQRSFETAGHDDGEPCQDMPAFTDTRDGSVYNTVRIGDKCWLKENLRYLPEVSPSSAGSETEPHYYVYDYQGTDVSEAMATDNYQSYGVLYNWPAVMNGEENSSSTNPNEVQGICPAGWHLPGDEEWTELVDYLMDEYDLTNDLDDVNAVGNKLKSCRQDGSPLAEDCATSEHPRWSSHNIHYGTDQFGFSALPGGYRGFGGDFEGIGYYCYWWSSTESSSEGAWRRYLRRGSGSMHRGEATKTAGFSVRCVRDIN